MRKRSLIFLIIMAVILWIAVPIFAADKPKPEKASVDWQELALYYKAQLEVKETQRLVSVEIGQACEDRMGTLIAQGRKSITDPAVLAWRDYMAKKKEIEKLAAAVEAARVEAEKAAEKEQPEPVPEPVPDSESAKE